MSIVFFGTPEFALPSLDALISAGEKVNLVITQFDRPKGRGHVLTAPPVKELALRHGIRVFQPRRLKDEGFLRELQSAGPDFIVVVAYGRLLPREVLSIPRIAPINLHASLLPEYRGAAPVSWAIINGEKQTGVTTMLITERLDEGDILLQEKVEISDDDTAQTLGRRLSLIGAPLLIKSIEGLRAGSLKARPQEGQPSYAPSLKKQDGRVLWSRPAQELFNFVRGMHPWPGAYCILDDKKITLLKVRPLDGVGTIGRVEAVEKDSIIVGTGSGLLSVEGLKIEGKRAMTTREFLLGRRLGMGELLQ